MRTRVIFGLTILLFIIFVGNAFAAYTWSTTTPLPEARKWHGSAADNQHLYVVSGGSIFGFDFTVLVAPINANGTLGSWDTTAFLPQNLSYIKDAVSAYNGKLYVMCGEDEYSATMNPYVYMATINPDGSLGSWNIASPALPHGGNDCHSTVIYNGYIYDIAGECNDIYSSYFLTDKVYYAQISTNGMIGDWTETTSVPMPTWFGKAVAMNGYMIFYGGSTAWSSASYNINQNVYVAPINANGSLGTWILQTAQMPLPVYDFAGVGVGNKIFSIGGRTVGSVRIDTTYWAPFANGTVGNWVMDSNYLKPVYAMPAVVGTAVDGQQRIYCTGGYSTTGESFLADVGVSNSIATVALTPIINVSPSSIDYGLLYVGTTTDNLVRISNIGYSTLTVFSVTTSGSSDYTRFWSGASTLTAGQYTEVTVRFTPSSIGTQNGMLAITSNDTSSPTVNVPLTGNGVVSPDIDIQPASFTKNILQGQILYATMTIFNTQSGSSPLAWQITDSVDSIGGFSIAGSGGPDTYGYQWIDSDELGGPIYNWTDISAIGTPITGLGDDNNAGPYPIGFTFPFYGTNFTSFRLCSNGWISFTSSDVQYSNTTIPDPYAPLNLVAPFWDDLYFYSYTTAYYYSDGNRLVVSYVNVEPLNGSGTYNFQIIVNRSGEIVYQYQSLTGITNGCTVGIQNADGTKGLQVAYNENYLHDNLAIRISCDYLDWLDENPKSGATAGGSYSLVTITFDATNLSPGDTTGYMRVSSNDSDEPTVYVPVTLHVLPGPPQLNVAIDTINYGSLYIGASADSVVRITNSGYGILTVSNIAIAGDTIGFRRIGSGDLAIAQNQYGDILLRFAPGSLGAKTGTLTFSSNDTSSSDTTVFLTGIGVTPPDIAVFPNPLPWATVIQGSTTYGQFTISNTGGSNITYTIRDAVSMVTTASIKSEIRNPKSEICNAASNTPKPFTIQSKAEYVKDELLVKFKPTTQLSAMNTINAEIGVQQMKYYSSIGVTRLKITSGKSIADAIATYAKYREQVEFAEPNYIVHINRTPNDPSYSQLWGMNNTGQTGGTPDADIDAPEAWDLGTGSNDVVIGVIDTGVDYTHPDLKNNIWHNSAEIPFNGIDDDGNGYVDDTIGWDFVNNDNNPMDDNEHGSHCSGTIAGEGNNSIGVVGVMWRAKIMPLKFLDASGSGNTADAIEAILYATRMGVKLTSNSWGSNLGAPFDPSLYAAISAANAAGQLFIAAAGNDYLNNNDVNPSYPASYDLPNIIAVAATDHNDNLASFSNYGPTSVDVGAPGVNIYSTVPGGYDSFNGTSMATPHVSGACGLIWSMNLSATNTQVKQTLMNTVDIVTSLTGKCVTNGRINVYKALMEAGLPWLDENQKSGTVPAAGYSIITVTYDATELPIGDTTGYIIINSNDPDENPVNVLASVHVIAGPPAINVAPLSINYWAVYNGVSVDNLVRITNPAYGILTVTNIQVTSGSSDYTRFWSGNIRLTRNQYADITVRFTPSANGTRNGTLTINSNVSTVLVSLTGIGITPPDIDIQPQSFYKMMLQGTILYDMMTIRNTASTGTTLTWLITEGLTSTGILSITEDPDIKPHEVVQLPYTLGVDPDRFIRNNNNKNINNIAPSFAGSGWMIGSGMNSARYRATAAAVNGKVYVIGGWDATGYAVLNSVEMFDPALGTWSSKANKPTGLANICSGVIGNKIYVAGGYDASYNYHAELEIYDTQYNTWTTGASLPKALCGAGAAVVNDKLYVIGGSSASGKLNTCYEYNPGTNTWSQKSSMNYIRNYPGAAVVNNKIYTIGGWTETSNAAYCEEYNPASNTWTIKSAMNLARGDLGVCSDGSYVYAIGGGSVWANWTTVVERYNPQTNSWMMSNATIPYLNYARNALSVAINNNGTIYALAGFNGSALNVNESYNPDVLDWLDETPKSGLNAGGTYSQISINFDTTNLPTGETTGYIIVSSNDPDEAAVSIPVTLMVYVTGTPEISLSPANINYGTVTTGMSIDRPIRITNVGYGILTVNNITANLIDYYPIGSVNLQLARNQYEDVMIRFHPNAAGTRSAVLSVSSNDPTFPITTINLSGVGVLAPTAVIPEVWRKY